MSDLTLTEWALVINAVEFFALLAIGYWCGWDLGPSWRETFLSIWPWWRK